MPMVSSIFMFPRQFLTLVQGGRSISPSRNSIHREAQPLHIDTFVPIEYFGTNNPSPERLSQPLTYLEPVC
jgi:hypothetical protein